MRGLLKISLFHERFLESLPYDLNEMKARAEGILQVVESRQQIVNSTTIVVLQHNSRSRNAKDNVLEFVP